MTGDSRGLNTCGYLTKQSGATGGTFSIYINTVVAVALSTDSARRGVIAAIVLAANGALLNMLGAQPAIIISATGDTFKANFLITNGTRLNPTTMANFFLAAMTSIEAVGMHQMLMIAQS